MQLRYLAVLFLLIACEPAPPEEASEPTPTPKPKDILEYVDPFIGTGGHGHTFPGATTPFGMVQLSPDTHLDGWDASSGYHFDDRQIYGFSHTHLSGTGIGDMGDLLLLPFTGDIQDSLSATFVKSEEIASPAYYYVRLQNFDIKAELTASPYVGWHRYSYPASTERQLLIDLGHTLQKDWGHRPVEGELQFVNDQTIKGMRRTKGWAQDHPVYFYITFSSPYEVKDIRNSDSTTDKLATGAQTKAYLTFGESQQSLIITVGLSTVSMEGAMKNWQSEAANKHFDQIRSDSERLWRNALQKIAITTADEAVKTNFYTALYHSMLMPILAQDVDGAYRKMNGQQGQLPYGESNYTAFSLWDTHRAWHPLMTLIEPRKSKAWADNILRKYQEGGVLPKWPLASNYTGTMIGYPATSFLADMLNKEIGNIDANLALEAALASARYQAKHPNVAPAYLDAISRKGYIPAEQAVGSVSYGLECAYYDWCIAKIAKKAGDLAKAETYMQRSKNYQNYFDTESGFMRAKLANGNWKTPFSPNFSDHAEGDYIEGNAWQWSWSVLHDIPGLIKLHGGREAFAERLDELFTTNSRVEGDHASGDISGLIGQYAHGNEPSHHIAHLYNYAGQAWKTQERIDEILQKFYQPKPDGIIGNEDAGQMSAWYIFNALGFYPVCPGSNTYSIGRPLVDEARIQLNGGQVFYVEVVNNSPENKYVQEVRINEKRLTQPFFQHEDIKHGNRLRFIMGPTPKKD